VHLVYVFDDGQHDDFRFKIRSSTRLEIEAGPPHRLRILVKPRDPPAPGGRLAEVPTVEFKSAKGPVP
jgi:hypothetical protein